MTTYPAAHWAALGVWVGRARRAAGYADTLAWAEAVGRSSRVVLGLERGEPAGDRTLQGVARALDVQLRDLLEILHTGVQPSLSIVGAATTAPDAAAPEDDQPDLVALARRIRRLEQRVEQLERADASSERPSLAVAAHDEDFTIEDEQEQQADNEFP